MELLTKLRNRMDCISLLIWSTVISHDGFCLFDILLNDFLVLCLQFPSMPTLQVLKTDEAAEDITQGTGSEAYSTVVTKYEIFKRLSLAILSELNTKL